MKKYHHTKEIAGLLASLAAGEPSPEKQETLDKWRAESPENERLYHEILSGDFAQRKIGFMLETDINEAYSEFRSMVRAGSGNRKTLRSRVLRIACVAAVAVMIPGGYFFFSGKYGHSRHGSQESVTHGRLKAILTTEDGTQVDISAVDYLDVLAEATVCPGGDDSEGCVEEANMRYHTITIPRCGEYSFRLEDGSRIYMNAESEIRIPVSFGRARREVYIRGEAFFEVARDESTPFVVHTSHGQVNVLGTSFNVRDYDDENHLETTLISGSVMFDREGKESLLTPGHQLKVNKTSGKVTVSEVDTRLYTAWKEGRFVFEQERLETILTTLSRWYDIEVCYEHPGLKDILFTGNIKKYENFDKVREMLSLVNKVEMDNDGGVVSVRSKY